jgi:hypothetical protein
MAPKRQRQPHSAEFFGPQRDHWWNRDHLALIAARFGLESVRSALDVGCGVGHWGVILVAEPNNRASLLVDTSVNAGAPVEDLLERLWFALTCERGKAALGEGHNSIGDLLPGYLAEEGVENVQTFISDKTEALVPPYGSEGQQALRAYTIKQAGRRPGAGHARTRAGSSPPVVEARMSSTSPGGDGRKRTGPRHVRWREAPSTPRAAPSCT